MQNILIFYHYYEALMSMRPLVRTAYTTHPSPDTHARCNPQTHAHVNSPCPLGPISGQQEVASGCACLPGCPAPALLDSGRGCGRGIACAPRRRRGSCAARRAPRRAPPVGNTRSRHRLQRGWAASTRAGQVRRRTWLSPPKPDRLAWPCCSHAWEETPPYWHTPGAVT